MTSSPYRSSSLQFEKRRASARILLTSGDHRDGCVFVAGVLATFVTQANVAEGYAVGIAVLALATFGIWKMERIFLRTE